MHAFFGTHTRARVCVCTRIPVMHEYAYIHNTLFSPELTCAFVCACAWAVSR